MLYMHTGFFQLVSFNCRANFMNDRSHLRSLIVNSATLRAPEKFSNVFPCYSLGSCRQYWCFRLSNRDTHNLETRFAVVAQPICRTSISVVRSLEVSAGTCVYLPSLFPEAAGGRAGPELQQQS